MLCGSPRFYRVISLIFKQSWESSKYVKEPDSGLEAQTINLTGQDI